MVVVYLCVSVCESGGGGGEGDGRGKGEGVGGWVIDTEWVTQLRRDQTQVLPRQLTFILPAINIINLLKTMQ